MVRLWHARKQSVGEELANAVTHGIAALLVLCSMPAMAIIAYSKGATADVACMSIFCISIFLMFLMSTLYHAMEHESRHKKIFKILDHIFIYIAIAGSYTPIALRVIGGWKAVAILAVQWAMVLAGIFYKSLARKSMPKISMALYLVMGWTVVLILPSFYRNANPVLFWLVVAGGAFCIEGLYRRAAESAEKQEGTQTEASPPGQSCAADVY
ncbi:MAG: hemolysin III family protein [Proteobacteria bacterium]|nr:hemolysin III family protein [Pseudomonadota bacterium]